MTGNDSLIWKIRSVLVRLLLGKDDELSTLCFLQCLLDNNRLPKSGWESRIGHVVSNKVMGRKSYFISIYASEGEPK